MAMLRSLVNRWRIGDIPRETWEKARDFLTEAFRELERVLGIVQGELERITTVVNVTKDGNVGIGIEGTTFKADVYQSIDAGLTARVYNPNTGTSAQAIAQVRSDTAIFSIIGHGSGRTLVRFGQTLGGWGEILGVAGNGFILGTIGQPLILGTSSTSRIYIQAAGNIGVGNTAPGTRLHVKADATNGGIFLERGGAAQDTDFRFLNDSGNTRWTLRADGTAPEDLFFYANATTQDLILQASKAGAAMGNVGIGLTNPSDRLHVAGNVRITGGAFIDDGVTLFAPDYVFEPGYALMPLPELGRFVERERRLPGVPSAEEIRENGLNLSEMQMRLLEKVEELTLYVLQLERRIQVLEGKRPL